MKDEECAKTKLQLALALGAKHGLENILSEHLFRRTTAALCTYALKHGIETDYVKRIIHAQHLAAPSPEIADWPWPVRIRALGRFSLEIAGFLLGQSTEETARAAQGAGGHGRVSGIGAAIVMRRLAQELYVRLLAGTLDLDSHTPLTGRLRCEVTNAKGEKLQLDLAFVEIGNAC